MDWAFGLRFRIRGMRRHNSIYWRRKGELDRLRLRLYPLGGGREGDSGLGSGGHESRSTVGYLWVPSKGPNRWMSGWTASKAASEPLLEPQRSATIFTLDVSSNPTPFMDYIRVSFRFSHTLLSFSDRAFSPTRPRLSKQPSHFFSHTFHPSHGRQSRLTNISASNASRLRNLQTNVDPHPPLQPIRTHPQRHV